MGQMLFDLDLCTLPAEGRDKHKKFVQFHYESGDRKLKEENNLQLMCDHDLELS